MTVKTSAKIGVYWRNNDDTLTLQHHDSGLPRGSREFHDHYVPEVMKFEHMKKYGES